MASESNFESSTIDLTSERSQPSRTTTETEKDKTKRSKIWDYCQELPESEARENSKVIYGYNQCVFKTGQTTNFRMHYLRQHGVNIPTKSGRTYRTEEAEQNLDDITKLYSTIELQDKMLKDTLDLNVIKATLLKLLLVQNIAFRIIKTNEFKAFILALNRQALTHLPTSHNTVRVKVPILFNLKILYGSNYNIARE